MRAVQASNTLGALGWGHSLLCCAIPPRSLGVQVGTKDGDAGTDQSLLAQVLRVYECMNVCECECLCLLSV
jgi:hypothetical protein